MTDNGWLAVSNCWMIYYDDNVRQTNKTTREEEQLQQREKQKINSRDPRFGRR